MNKKINWMISNDIANINSKKINSIIQNHKNLKILKNKPNSGIKENEEENKGNNNDKEKGQKFEDNLYSSEDGNIIDSDEESDSKSEIVKEIKERKARDSSMSKSLLYLVSWINFPLSIVIPKGSPPVPLPVKSTNPPPVIDTYELFCSDIFVRYWPAFPKYLVTAISTRVES